MAIATTFEITYGCGHAGVADLSVVPADQRGGRLEFFKSKGVCGDCWDDTRDKRRELNRSKYIADLRKSEQQQAAEWASEEGYALLSGSPKQIDAAGRLRYSLMRDLYGWAVEDGNDPDAYDAAEDVARNIDQARWWLDQRTLVCDHKWQLASPQDLLELLAAAGKSHAGQRCENPI